MLTETVKHNYAFFRSSLRMTATKSLEAAKRATGKQPSREVQGRLMFVTSSGTEKACHDWRASPVVYVEVPEDVGLRFVGYADEIAPRRVEHTGWWLDPQGDGDTYRGCVFQLPSRGGLPVYVPGYQRVSGHKGIPSESGFLVALRRRDWTLGERDDNESGNRGRAAHDCASTADDIAKRDAETERDYQESWQLGSRFADLREQAKESRFERRRLVASLRAARCEMAKLRIDSGWSRDLCAVVRAKVAALKEQSRKYYAEAEKILADNPYADKAAFNEGAGNDVL